MRTTRNDERIKGWPWDLFFPTYERQTSSDGIAEHFRVALFFIQRKTG